MTGVNLHVLKPIFDDGPNSSGRPDPDFIVATSIDGAVVSRYGDLVWDFSVYEHNGRGYELDFKFWGAGDFSLSRSVLLDDIKWLVFLCVFKRQGSVHALSTLRDNFVLFKNMAVFSEGVGVRVVSLFSDKDILLSFVAGSVYLASRLAPLMKFFFKLGDDEVGFRVELAAYRELRKLILERQNNEQQTTPMPTSVYEKFLISCGNEISDFEEVLERVLNLYQECAGDVFLGRLGSTQWRRRQEFSSQGEAVRPGFHKLLKRYDLEDYWNKKNLEYSVKGLSTALTEVLIVAAYQIQAFTGMRAGEVNSLRTDCLKEHKEGFDGVVHYVVNGFTTKFNSGNPFPAKWVTSKQGARAVRVIRCVASVIYDANLQRSQDSPETKFLFVSPIFGLYGRNNSPAQLAINKRRYSELYQRLIPIITENDIQELEQIDPHRAWRSEPNFQVGQLWPFRSHQLRRSLALYAQRSGLVSLPSLKRQLQHITLEMSMYYCKGSNLARDFLDDGEAHFSVEWQKSKAESEFLSYTVNVLPKRDSLFGTHVHWIKERLVQEDGSLLFDREETLKNFRKGLMVYRETSLGGCVNVDGCETTPIDLFEVECLKKRCKNLVGCKEKLKRVLSAQESLVTKIMAIDPLSPDARQEMGALEVLLETYSEVFSG